MKGILMRPEMHKAIQEGKKTVTRRLDGLKEINSEPDAWVFAAYDVGYKGFVFYRKGSLGLGLEKRIIKPRYKVGEVVYINEAWCAVKDGAPGECESTTKQDWDIIQYQDKWLLNPPDKCRVGRQSFAWRSPLFMPAWAARYFIKILDVRVERLQQITEEDAIAEGIEIMKGTHQAFTRNACGKLELIGELEPYTARYHYEALWDSINPKYPWASNPWNFRYEFKLVPRPG